MTNSPPPSVLRRAKDLANLPCEIQINVGNERNTWEIIAATDRVRFVWTFKINIAANRVKEIRKALTVDGGPFLRPIDNPEDLASVFTDPDKAIAPVELDPLPPHDPTNAPILLRHSYQALAPKLADREDIVLVLGSYDTDNWVMGLDFPAAKAGIRFYAVNNKKYQFGTETLQLVIDGKDFSRQVGGSFAKALELLLGSTDKTPATPKSTGRVSDVKSVAKSVEVRRTTVIRT